MMTCMKNKLCDYKGMTLTEVLVAAMLVGIVMMGAISVDYAIRNSRKSASQDTTLSMRTQATMLRISRDANMAVGDSSSKGIDTSAGALCIRKELGGNINSYSDDEWVCYWQNGTNIHRCSKNIALGGVPGPCIATDPIVGTAVSGQCSTQICEGTCPATQACFYYNFVFDSSTQRLYLDLAITNRYDPTKAKNPIANPEYAAATRIYPSGQGF